MQPCCGNVVRPKMIELKVPNIPFDSRRAEAYELLRSVEADKRIELNEKRSGWE